MLSPEEIRNKHFKNRMLGGYTANDVRHFLFEIAGEVQQLQGKNEELQSNLEACHKEIERLRQLETALLGAFKQAEEQKREMIEQAKQEAKMHVMRGEMSAENMINSAKKEAQDLLQRVKSECDLKIKQLNHEFSMLDSNFQEAEGHIAHVLKEMQRLVDETSQSIARIATLKDKKAVSEKMRVSKDMLEAHQQFTQKELDTWEKTHQVHLQETPPAVVTPIPAPAVTTPEPAPKEQGINKTLLQKLQENANGK
jgi:cell division initiation protein